jgi:hypothetical protein
MAAMARTCEGSLRIESAVAGPAWALNNLLLGAYTAAALSVVSAGRTTTSVAVMRSGASLRCAVFVTFASLTLGIAAATWDAQFSLWITVASLFHVRDVLHDRSFAALVHAGCFCPVDGACLVARLLGASGGQCRHRSGSSLRGLARLPFADDGMAHAILAACQ